MPSARLKLVKLAAPSAAAASLSPFCSSNPRACIVVLHQGMSLQSDIFESDDCRRAGSCSSSHLTTAPFCNIALPPQRHHFSNKCHWLRNYRRWLKSSKAIWFQRLHRQHSILQFFASQPRRGPHHALVAAPKRAAEQVGSRNKLKNATLEAYGARAGSFKTSRLCSSTESRPTQLN